MFVMYVFYVDIFVWVRILWPVADKLYYNFELFCVYCYVYLFDVIYLQLSLTPYINQYLFLLLWYTNRLPVMMAARKLDGEDPNIIFMLRCIYGAVQAIAVLVTLFIYTKATAASNENGNAVKIYVPPPPQVSIA